MNKKSINTVVQNTDCCEHCDRLKNALQTMNARATAKLENFKNEIEKLKKQLKRKDERYVKMLQQNEKKTQVMKEKIALFQSRVRDLEEKNLELSRKNEELNLGVVKAKEKSNQIKNLSVDMIKKQEEENTQEIIKSEKKLQNNSNDSISNDLKELDEKILAKVNRISEIQRNLKMLSKRLLDLEEEKTRIAKKKYSLYGGVMKIGMSFIGQFGQIKGIYETLGDLNGGNKIVKNIRTGEEQIIPSRKLMRIRNQYDCGAQNIKKEYCIVESKVMVVREKIDNAEYDLAIEENELKKLEKKKIEEYGIIIKNDNEKSKEKKTPISPKDEINEYFCDDRQTSSELLEKVPEEKNNEEGVLIKETKNQENEKSNQKSFKLFGGKEINFIENHFEKKQVIEEKTELKTPSKEIKTNEEKQETEQKQKKGWFNFLRSPIEKNEKEEEDKEKKVKKPEPVEEKNIKEDLTSLRINSSEEKKREKLKMVQKPTRKKKRRRKRKNIDQKVLSK